MGPLNLKASHKPRSLFCPESVITTVKGAPTVQWIVVLTDLLVVVGFESAVHPFGPRVGPNVGACVTQVLPQCAAMLMVRPTMRTATEKAMISFCFIADLRSY